MKEKKTETSIINSIPTDNDVTAIDCENAEEQKVAEGVQKKKHAFDDDDKMIRT